MHTSLANHFLIVPNGASARFSCRLRARAWCACPAGVACALRAAAEPQAPEAPLRAALGAERRGVAAVRGAATVAVAGVGLLRAAENCPPTRNLSEQDSTPPKLEAPIAAVNCRRQKS